MMVEKHPYPVADRLASDKNTASILGFATEEIQVLEILAEHNADYEKAKCAPVPDYSPFPTTELPVLLSDSEIITRSTLNPKIVVNRLGTLEHYGFITSNRSHDSYGITPSGLASYTKIKMEVLGSEKRQ